MNPRMPLILAIFLAGLAGPAVAADSDPLAAISKAATQDSEPLPPEVVFQVRPEATAPDRIEVHFGVRKDYYLYRSRLKFVVEDGQSVALGTPQLPKGDEKTDEYFGKQEVYHHDFVARIPVSRGSLEPFPLKLQISWQGCWEGGLCYLPTTKTFEVQMPRATTVSALPAGGSDAGSGTSGSDGYVSKQDTLAGMIRSGSPLLMVGVFFLAGLALAFTPCVLPMVPIVAGIIMGSGHRVTRGRAFGLSAAYVLGMAATYTIAGVGFAAAGQQAQTLFQQPWIIALFAAMFLAMSLSMFGVYTVQMPSFIQTRLTELSNRQRGGHIAGVVMMGALSALIVTTCVGPALVAALTVIGQSGQVVRGGLALFSMAIGMGVPLLVVGASAGKLLPKAGPWMDAVKQLMGVLMLGVAMWMLSRIVPERVSYALWIVPVAALAVILWRSMSYSRARNLARFASVLIAGYAALMAVGVFRGATDPLHPLRAEAAHESLPFERIKSLEELNARVAAATSAGKSVMLDFYADWCVSCKEMEKHSFPQPAVRAALANTVWLQADVTANDATDQVLLKHFGIFGPPTIAFYGPEGTERRQYRVVGFMKAEEFAPLAARATAPAVAAAAMTQ